jgi:thymidylate kinase
MSTTLFALDEKAEEVIVSESPKGSNKINFIERIKRKDSEMLYNAVVTLTSISRAPAIDTAILKAIDKVCQLLYNKYKESGNS